MFFRLVNTINKWVHVKIELFIWGSNVPRGTMSRY